MVFFRWAILVLLVASGVLFALFAATGQPRYKRWGLVILKWTLIAAFGFFAVLIVERVF
jgi:predicted signal transduction protein with EAL and GGDEF domain